jgi:integrase/recombinase XerD
MLRQKIRAIQIQQIEFDPEPTTTKHKVVGQLAHTSRRIFLHDAGHFTRWMVGHACSHQLISRDDLVAYRASIGETYAKATASRIWAVACCMLEEVAPRRLLLSNTAEGVQCVKASDDESPHRALHREEAQALFEAINRSTASGNRDHAPFILLLRPGIRRSEATVLTLGDGTMELRYHVAIIQHSKVNKRRFVLLPVEVKQAIDSYLEAFECSELCPGASLFMDYHKGHHPQGIPISGTLVERVVKLCRRVIVVMKSPHGMRSSLITLAIEGSADLTLLQDVVRHQDPRRTRRYENQREPPKNTIDFVWILAEMFRRRENFVYHVV